MNDQDLRKLLNEIGNGIVRHLQKVPATEPTAAVSPKLPTLTKLQQVLAIGGSTVAIIAAILIGLNFVVTSAITSALIQPGKDLTKLQTQSEGIQKNMDRLLDWQAKSVLSGALRSAVSPPKAQDIKDAAIRGQDRNIAVPPETLIDIGNSLLQGAKTSSTPELWVALSEIVNYRMSIDSGTDVRSIIAKRALKDCSSQPPLLYGDSGANPGKEYIQKTPWEYRDCYLNLDHLNLSPLVMQKGGIGIRCVNCVVQYSGGDIPIKAEMVNCVFIFSLYSRPPEQGLRLAQKVLRNPKSVAIG